MEAMEAEDTQRPVAKDTTEQPEWLTVPEYARLMRISLTTAYRSASRGDIPTRKVGRIVRIPRSAVSLSSAYRAIARGEVAVRRVGRIVRVPRSAVEQEVRP